MVKPDRPPINNLNRLARKVYNPIGFNRFYNFVLWFIFSGALFGFILSRSGYVNYDNIFCGGDPAYGAGPGECWAYNREERYKVGIIMHLVTIVPACILVLIQFIPVVRHKAIIVHRINGYIVIILTLATLAGAFMIARIAFGGGLDTQMWVGFTAIIVILSYVMAYINIKRLQIDQHRKWMLRAWFYMASVISQRLIFMAAQDAITSIGSYFYAMPCAKIVGIYQQFGIPVRAVQGTYPICAPFFDGSYLNQYAIVHASKDGPGPENTAALLEICFGPTLWLALAIHAIGIEIYLHLTPREHERLRQVSYERQAERGMSHAGSSGLTSDRFGDSEPWTPQAKRSGKGDASQSGKNFVAQEGSPDSNHAVRHDSDERKESAPSQA